MRIELVWPTVVALSVLCSAAFTTAASTSQDMEWEKTIAAARAEGQVIIIGPTGADLREAYTAGFQKKYPGIQVEYNGMAGARVGPKLINELTAGIYANDLIFAGTITAIESLIPANAVVPIQPFLVGPDNYDPSKWKGNKFEFSDKAEKYNYVHGNRVQVAFVYNRNMVPAGKIKSWKDFLRPEWKGKIAMLHPRLAGASQGWATFWYIKESLGFGKNFISRLFSTQDIFMSNDQRQLLDSVARGRYPLAIGASGTLAFEMKNKGLPIEIFGSAALQEGGVLSAGSATLMIPRNPPHPNAAKLYLNYFLSREGQQIWSKASSLSSRRVDVSQDHIPDVFVPREGVTYLQDYKESFVTLRDEVVAFLETVIPQ
jgi:iron(III) transport system substrate-binding protein